MSDIFALNSIQASALLYKLKELLMVLTCPSSEILTAIKLKQFEMTYLHNWKIDSIRNLTTRETYVQRLVDRRLHTSYQMLMNV